MHKRWEIVIALAAALLAVPAAALASSGSGSGGSGGGGGGGGGATSTSATVLASVSVSPTKVAFLSVATGTVRLNKVAASPGTVSVSNDVFNSPNLVTMPTEVVVPAGSSSATFLVQAGEGAPGKTFAINVSADESPAADATVPRTQFYLLPSATTDIIRIPSAQLSPNGDLKLQATTDTASASLTAEFNGQAIPLRNNGGGRWEGQAKVPVSGGDVVVRSNLGGGAAKNPPAPTRPPLFLAHPAARPPRAPPPPPPPGGRAGGLGSCSWGAARM